MAAPPPKFPKEFQDQVNKACKYYSKPHKSDEIAKLPLASVALQATLLRNPLYAIDNHGRARSLKQIIHASLKELEATEPNTPEWECYLCLYSYILEKDPWTRQSFVNNVELYLNQSYHIPKGSYHRYKKDGLRHLSYQISSRLAQQTIWQEAVPQIWGVVERKKELPYYREQLKSEGLAVIEGVAGVGKTMLGAQLAKEFRVQRRPVCWQTIRPGINDSTLGILYGWAAFLAQHNYPALWIVMRTVATNVNPDAKQKGLSLSNLLPILRQGLTTVRPLLCLDKLEMVGKGSKEFWSLLDVVRQEPNTGLLLISEQRPPLARLGDYQVLGGFSPNEVADLLSRRNIYLTTEQLKMVMHFTLGNASLLELWVTDIRLQQADLSTSLAKLRHSQAATSLLNDILATLTDGQQRAASLLALSRKPLDSFLLQELPEALPPLRELGIEADDFTTLSQLDLLDHSLGDQWTLKPLLKQHLQAQLMPKEGLTSDEAISYHEWLAKWWSLQGNIVEAAYHEIGQQNQEQAVCRLREQQALLIEQGFAPAMSDLLASIQIEHLSPPVRQLMRKVRIELSQLLGDYGSATAEIEQAKEEAHTAVEEAEAKQAAGELAKRGGDFSQASDAYRDALKLLAPSRLTLEAKLHRDLAWSLIEESQLDEAWKEAQRTRIALENTLGQIARKRNKFEQAEQHYQQGIAIAQECGEYREQSRVRNNLAALYGYQKKYEQTMALYQRNLQLSEKIYDLQGKAITLMNLGNCYLDMGNQEAAIKHYLDAMSTFTALGDAYGQLLTHLNLARAYRRAEQLDVAAQHAEVVIKKEKAEVGHIAYIEGRRIYAEVLLAQGKPLNALSMAQEALESQRISESSNKFYDMHYAKLACETLADIHTALEQREEAEEYAQLAEEMMRGG